MSSGVILDLDGTLCRGDEVIPGADTFVAGLRSSGTPFVYYTNRAVKTPCQIAEKLKRIGLDPAVSPGQVLTSAIVTARMVAHHYGKRAFCLGSDALKGALDAEGVGLDDFMPPSMCCRGWACCGPAR